MSIMVKDQRLATEVHLAILSQNYATEVSDAVVQASRSLIELQQSHRAALRRQAVACNQRRARQSQRTIRIDGARQAMRAASMAA